MEDYSKLSVKELQVQLKKLGLSATGLKSELVERITKRANKESEGGKSKETEGKNSILPEGVDIPDVTYTIAATTLVGLIHNLQSTKTTHTEFFDALFEELKPFSVQIKKPEAVKPKSPAKSPAKSSPKKATKEPPKEVLPLKVAFDQKLGVYIEKNYGGYVFDITTKSFYAKIDNNEVVPLTEEDVKIMEALPKKITFWHKLQGLDRLPNKEEVEALNNENLEIVKKKRAPVKETPKEVPKVEIPKVVEKKEVPKIVEKEAPKVEAPKEEKTTAIGREDVLAEFQRQLAANIVAPKVAPKEAVTSVTEKTGEGESDGTETVIQVTAPQVVFAEKKGDAIDRFNESMAVLTNPKVDITEAQFVAYVKAQNKGTVNKLDSGAIAKEAGLSEEVGQTIVSQYKSLSDKYRKAIASLPPPNQPVVLEKRKEAVLPPGKRTLLKKKD